MRRVKGNARKRMVSKCLNGLKGLKRDVKRSKTNCDLSTAKPNGNLQKISELIREDRIVRAVAELAEIDKKKCSEHFFVQCMNISADILNGIVREQGLLQKMIICDESWLFIYDTGIKRQSAHRKSSNSKINVDQICQNCRLSLLKQFFL